MPRPKQKPYKPPPTPVTIIMPPRDYQPSKAEREEEVIFPNVDASFIAGAFFRPVNAKVTPSVKPGKSKKVKP